MSVRPSTSLRNKRKHFVKCMDCGCQTLPQNASKEQPWAAAASLYISGRINDGALCFKCANLRRAVLGLPLEKPAGNSDESSGSGSRPILAPACKATPKTVHINRREYIWEVSNLESLMMKVRQHGFYGEDKSENAGKGWSVDVNNRLISADGFSSVPISDGDEIAITLGVPPRKPTAPRENCCDE